MKKLVMALFVIMNIFIVNQTAEAAYIYIPNFRELVSNSITLHIEFLGMDQKVYKGVEYTCWKYKVVDGETGAYMDKYIKKCTSRFDFVFLGGDSSNWLLRYKGGQAKYVKAFENKFHMLIKRNGSRVNINVVAGMFPE